MIHFMYEIKKWEKLNYKLASPTFYILSELISKSTIKMMTLALHYYNFTVSSNYCVGF